MTAQDLIIEAEQIEQKVAGAALDVRLSLQPVFSSVLDRLRAEGVEIPSRLRRLDDRLCDEALEARFDNMPV